MLQISASFTELQIMSKNFRLFQRVKLLKEYKDVKRAPPPLNVVLHPLMSLLRSMMPHLTEHRRGFSAEKSSNASKELSLIEQAALRAYIKLSKTREAETLESRVKRVDEGIDRLEDEMRRGFDWLTTRVDRFQEGTPDGLVEELRNCTNENMRLRQELAELKQMVNEKMNR